MSTNVVNNTTVGLLGYWTTTKDDIVVFLNILGPLICGTESNAATTSTFKFEGAGGCFISYSTRTRKITIKPNTNIYFVDSSKNYLTKSMGELLGFRENISKNTDVIATTPLNFSQN